VIFVDGQNDGRMIAHDGGWKARIPAFILDPECRLAMRDARYPVTKAGILGLVETMLAIHRDDVVRDSVAICKLTRNQPFDGRVCDVYTTEYKSRAESPTYRKSVTFLDQEWNIPIHSQHFEWPSGSAERLKVSSLIRQQ